MRLAVLVMTFLFSLPGVAKTLTFQSKLDTFDLEYTGTRGKVDGKPANLSTIKEILPLLSKPLSSPCPTLPKNADLTIRSGSSTKNLYLESELLSENGQCLQITGEGLHYLPVHRDFLIGPKKGAIQLQSNLKIFKQGIKILDIKKDGDEWVTNEGDLLVDWDFVRRLEDSLRDFTIRLRVQTSLAKDKPKMIIQNGNQTLEFYKVTKIMWATKLPGTDWLTASDDWSFWRDFESDMLEDRFADGIRRVESATDKDAKRAALKEVDVGWSPNLRRMYHKLALSETEDSSIRMMALKRLKQKPALETCGVMLKILETSQDPDIQDEASTILKLNNPKGPKFKSNSSEEERKKALEYWRTWWRDKQKSN
ncbi:MAG: hypothetical protein AB7F86_13775 [Bdellovibrionales bacterium]